MSDRLDAMTYLQAFGAGLAIAGLYFYFLYSAQNVDAVINRINQDIAQTTLEISQKDALIKEKQSVEAEILKNASSFSKSQEIIGQNLDKSSALEVLTNKSRELGLAIKGLGTFSEWAQVETVEKASINVKLEGTFEQLMFLFSDLTRDRNFYNIERISIKPSQSTGEGGRELEIVIDFLVFRESKRLASDLEKRG